METPEPSPSARRSRFGFSGIPRKVRWIVFSNAFGAVGFGYLTVFITAYFPEVGVSSQVVGLLLGAVGVSMVVSAAPLGIYSDRRGRKGLLLIGSAILPPSILVFALTTDVKWMVLAALVAGVGEGAFLSSWNAIIADQTTVEQRNAAFALSFVLNNVFSGVGFALPLSFPFIQAQTGLGSQTIHVAALVITDGLGFVMPVAFYFLLRDYRETIRGREARPKGMDWKPLLKFSGINGLIGLGAGFFIPLVPTWLFLKFQVPDTWSGPLLALANVTIGLAATVSASLAKRYGPVRAIVMAQGLSTVFMFSLAFVTNAFAAAGLYLVRAALMNMSAPIGDSFLMGIVAPEQRGLASAVNSIIWRLPNSVTTILGGILMAGGYLDIPIFLATAFYLASISSFYIVFRNVPPSR
ncbi:MAG: MFS transporter [Methanobacteriota archaeon]|nr:MAG: MFS transporter [Euryarchaeota archaeon]